MIPVVRLMRTLTQLSREKQFSGGLLILKNGKRIFNQRDTDGPTRKRKLLYSETPGFHGQHYQETFYRCVSDTTLVEQGVSEPG